MYRESDQEHFWLSSHILTLKTYHTVSIASLEWTNSVEKINGKFSSKDGMFLLKGPLILEKVSFDLTRGLRNMSQR